MNSNYPFRSGLLASPVVILFAILAGGHAVGVETGGGETGRGLHGAPLPSGYQTCGASRRPRSRLGLDP